MADDDAKSDEAADSSGGDDKKSGGGALGPIVAVILVMLLGAGVALAFTWALTDADDDADPANPTTVEGDRDQDRQPLIDTHVAIELGEILANVSHEQGRRYVKVSVQVWVKKEDSAQLLRPEYQPMMQEVVREHLRTYDLNQLDHESVTLSIKRQVQEAMNKVLREVMAASDPERRYIEKVVLQNFLVQ